MQTPMRRSQLSLDTHAYDGKLKDCEHFKDIIDVSNISRDRSELFEIVKVKLQSADWNQFLPHKNICISRYSTIVSHAHQPPNFDSTNGVYADDLLFKVCHIIETKSEPDQRDVIDMLILQLVDMGTGFCPQGRTTRLYQILNTFVIL